MATVPETRFATALAGRTATLPSGARGLHSRGPVRATGDAVSHQRQDAQQRREIDVNIYERLKQDHETQKDLAAKIAETSGDSEERRQLFARFRREAEAHANAEEQVFYAKLLKSPDSQEQARHSVSEHEEASDLLDELADLDMSSPGWLSKFKTLKDELEHHIEEEEEEVFALARSVLPENDEERMTEAFAERKSAEV